MATYMFMLFDDESWYDDTTAQDWQDEMELHTNFAAAVEAVGARIIESAALERSSSATTVRSQRGGASPLVTDGPFVETKEALGGFYLIEASDLDQALDLATRCPSRNVEVRPVMDASQDPQGTSG